MKTIDLYLSVLRDVRYNVMEKHGAKLTDFEVGSNGYNLLCSLNEAANKLNDLINIMEYEYKIDL